MKQGWNFTPSSVSFNPDEIDTCVEQAKVSVYLNNAEGATLKAHVDIWYTDGSSHKDGSRVGGCMESQ